MVYSHDNERFRKLGWGCAFGILGCCAAVKTAFNVSIVFFSQGILGKYDNQSLRFGAGLSSPALSETAAMLFIPLAITLGKSSYNHISHVARMIEDYGKNHPLLTTFLRT